MIALVPTYRRTGSALHATRAGVAVAYAAALGVVALVHDHPLVLVAALAGVVGAGLAAGVGRELVRAARFAVPLAVLVALVNPLVSQQGLTLLVRGPELPVLGRVDVTLEALAYGGIAGLRVLVIVGTFALYSAAVNPDEILRLLRRVSLRSALTVSLATRLVPVLGRDAGRLSDAYELRAAVPARVGGRLARLRRASVVTRALAAGALERAVDLAAALEVRGYALAPDRGARQRTPWSRHDLLFAVTALVIVTLAVGGRVAGLAGFEAYPLLRADLGLIDAGFALAVAALALAPFAGAALGLRRVRGRAAHLSPAARSARV